MEDSAVKFKDKDAIYNVLTRKLRPIKYKVAIILCCDNTDYIKKYREMNRTLFHSLKLNGLSPFVIFSHNILDDLNYLKPSGIVLPDNGFLLPANVYDGDHEVARNLDGYNVYINGINYAIRNELPTLGICSGGQFMGVYLGGKLAKIKNHNAKMKHEVFVSRNSLIGSALNASRISVVSSHNYGLVTSGQARFSITAMSKDGVIHGIEPVNAWNSFVLGVQWRPENEHKRSPSAGIFRKFAEQIKSESR